MPLLIEIVDFENEVIAKLNDQTGTLDEVLNYCYQNPLQTKVIKYIDMYDDTTLNSLQIKDLMSDICFIQNQQHLMNNERFEFLSNLIRLCEKAIEEPHLYLKFYGD